MKKFINFIIITSNILSLFDEESFYFLSNNMKIKWEDACQNYTLIHLFSVEEEMKKIILSLKNVLMDT